MSFSVLIRKGKVPRFNFHPLSPGPEGGGPCTGWLPCLGAFVQHPVWVPPPVPRRSEEADISWRCPQGRVPRLCPAVITEGARRPGPSQPSGSSGRPNRDQVPGTATHGDCHRHWVAEVGMGERFAAASRPGPGQWAAVARALELCRTQPSACPPATPAHPPA